MQDSASKGSCFTMRIFRNLGFVSSPIVSRAVSKTLHRQTRWTSPDTSWIGSDGVRPRKNSRRFMAVCHPISIYEVEVSSPWNAGSAPPIASEIQNHVKMVQSACGEPRRSLRDKHEGGSDEQTRFHPSEHRGTCSRHDPCRWQREGG